MRSSAQRSCKASPRTVQPQPQPLHLEALRSPPSAETPGSSGPHCPPQLWHSLLSARSAGDISVEFRTCRAWCLAHNPQHHGTPPMCGEIVLPRCPSSVAQHASALHVSCKRPRYAPHQLVQTESSWSARGSNTSATAFNSKRTASCIHSHSSSSMLVSCQGVHLRQTIVVRMCTQRRGDCTIQCTIASTAPLPSVLQACMPPSPQCAANSSALIVLTLLYRIAGPPVKDELA